MIESTVDSGIVARMLESWRRRHLVAFFAGRALEKIYARTVLGVAWVLIRPLFPVAVNTVVFGNMLGVQTGPIPYFLFFLIGMTLWHLFDSSLMWVTRSLELNRKLLTKLYFPRLLLPVSYLAPGLVDCAVYLLLILDAALFFWVRDGHQYVALDPRLVVAAGCMVLAVLLALGAGLWTSVLGARARDVRFTLAYLMGFLFSVTPVLYPATYVPERWRWLLIFNPMASLIETFRWATLGVGDPSPAGLGVACLLIGALVASGLWFFNRAEAEAVDNL